MQKALSDFVIHTLTENLVILYAQIHQGGERVAEYNRLGVKSRMNLKSIAKGVVSCAVGIAIDEGLIRLDETIAEIFPEYMPDNPGDLLPKITIEHLLTMTSGLEKPLFFADSSERFVVQDWIGHFFGASFIHEPGTKWLYSNFNTYMVSCAIERRSGVNLLEYLRHRYFEPIGIGNPDWTFCPKGHCHAANGLSLTIDELSRYAELIKNYGRFGDRQIVPEPYMRRATSNLVQNHGKKPWESCGYGYQFLMNPEKGSFRSEGRFGQFCLAFPEQDTIISVISMDRNFHRIGDLIWQDLVARIV